MLLTPRSELSLNLSFDSSYFPFLYTRTPMEGTRTVPCTCFTSSPSSFFTDFPRTSLYSIAMFVVGGILLLLYCFYEIKYAPYPSSPKRLLFNKTFSTAVVIK